MRIILLLPALVAGVAAAQDAGRASPADPQAKVPNVQYGSAFEGYRPFVEQELRDWRKSNDEVGAAGAHAGHRPGQGGSKATSKPQPGKPEGSGGAAEKGGAPAHGGHR
jgi:hypothetical protein